MLLLSSSHYIKFENYLFSKSLILFSNSEILLFIDLLLVNFLIAMNIKITGTSINISVLNIWKKSSGEIDTIT